MNKLYVCVVILVAAAFTVVFDTFPRSTVSELEKRELTKFPEFSIGRLASGEFTRDVSAWFSDSEPYRDMLMALSMKTRDLLTLNVGGEEESVRFHASTDTTEPTEEEQDSDEPANIDNSSANEKAKIANAGIIVIGSGPKVRAVMAFGGKGSGGGRYAAVANKYKATFPNVNVYCMVIPTAIEFYCPDKVRNRTASQKAAIDNIYRHLNGGVKGVDVYSALSRHTAEDIYLRTDHHWAPLGGYYAARELAKACGVPFKDLDSYDRHELRNYVGSMYGYSKDIAIKEAPEDFVYYTPKDAKYTTTYIVYDIDEDFQITGEQAPIQAPFFYKFKDGSTNAYSTFMGMDSRITKVRTDVNNGRRILLLKDSFGNAIPGYLFYSFEEVHVVDSRFFTKNMRDYVRDNKITDIVFCNNIFHAYAGTANKAYLKFLE
ncbi:MAG: hypothetical protein K6A98_05650 [Prevotella sp.]|nr:hypothetical protein [Prevotella sp.]